MDEHRTASQRQFTRFAWALLVYNIPVILWGAYVRISFSGDGCGANWPFCNGQIIPQHMKAPMAIEFAHRLMTGADSLAAILLCVWAFRAFRSGHVVRRFAAWFLVFLLVEGILGAGLVLLRYVAHDASAGRAVYLAAHLTNTLLLLGALTVTAWSSQRSLVRPVPSEEPSWRVAFRAFAGPIAVSLLISITGAIAALGDTLFPASSLASGMRQDLSNASSLLLRLRMFHPAIALFGGLYLVVVAVRILQRREPPARHAAMRVLSLIALQVIAGILNLAFLAPVGMQIIHLALADLLWVAVVLLALEAAPVKSPSSIYKSVNLIPIPR